MSLHFDPRLTWTHVITTISAVFVLGGAWVQIGNLNEQIGLLSDSVRRSADRVVQVESRTTVLETQRRDSDRRLDEIRSDVRWVRERLERGPAQ